MITLVNSSLYKEVVLTLNLRLLSILFLVAVVSSLTACGGGGDASSNQNNSGANQTSVVTAAVVQLGEVAPSSNVSLDASASSDSLNGNLTYSWQQTSGVSVTIANATSATASFTAPDATNVMQTLIFEVTVSSTSASNSVSVTSVIAAEDSEQPNILFILSDDQGLDASAQYNISTD